MKDFLIFVGIGLMAVPMAWCTVEQSRSRNSHTMSKAEFCKAQGGKFDFKWGECFYEEAVK
jgi:hypothetical protein